jgi:hypothetical protein
MKSKRLNLMITVTGRVSMSILMGLWTLMMIYVFVDLAVQEGNILVPILSMFLIYVPFAWLVILLQDWRRKREESK